VFIIEIGGHMFTALHHWVSGNIGQTNSWLAQFILITLVMIQPGRSFYNSGLPIQDLVNRVTLWFVFGPDPAL